MKSPVMKRLKEELKNVEPMPLEELRKMTPERLYKCGIKKLTSVYLGIGKELARINDLKKKQKEEFDDRMDSGQFTGISFTVQIRMNGLVKKEEAKWVYNLAKKSDDKQLSKAVCNYFDAYDLKKKETK